MNKEELKSFHYNNQNEIQFKYGGQTHHYSMECLKDIICNYFNNLKEIERLQNIIKEVREHINKAIDEGWDYHEKDKLLFESLEILDKENI